MYRRSKFLQLMISGGKMGQHLVVNFLQRNKQMKKKIKNIVLKNNLVRKAKTILEASSDSVDLRWLYS